MSRSQTEIDSRSFANVKALEGIKKLLENENIRSNVFDILMNRFNNLRKLILVHL